MSGSTTRLRLSHAKANLISSLSEEQVERMIKLLEGVPSEEEVLRGTVPFAPETQFATRKVLPEPEPVYPAHFLEGNPDNVLVIGDLHAPFIREGYLEFCLQRQKDLNCGTVIFIGDICDQHAISYHESDPDGMSAGQEYKKTKAALKKVFAMFPTAFCCLGNHDLLVARKAKTAGLSQHFVRSLGEIYGAPATWEFVDEVEINDVVYRHGGAGGDALRMATHSRRSTVQGHLHTKFYTQWLVSERDAIFALQVGCGTDDKAYAFAYGRPFPMKSAIGCAAVLDKGKLPMNLLMPL